MYSKEQSYREDAMEWWNALSSAGKTRRCDTNTELVGSVRRWETLTGREIEMIYDAEQRLAQEHRMDYFSEDRANKAGSTTRFTENEV